MLVLERIAGENFDRTDSGDKRFCKHFQEEIEAALSARAEYDADILDALRQYEGVPKTPYRSSPIENAPNIEITLGAIATDALYAQAMTTIFAVNPILTVNATKESGTKAASALQDFTNWGIDNEFGMRQAAEHSVMDVIQLGTGAIYTPYIDVVRKTQTRRIVDRGPRIQPVPIENLIVPGGCTQDINQAPWVAIRMFMSFAEVKARAVLPDDARERWKLHRGTLSPFMPCASMSAVQMQREAMSRTSSNTKMRKLYEVYAIYATFDYDRDDEDEEILAFWDRSSNTLGWIGYTPNDYRPINKEVYQVRAHSWNGLGVMKMLAPYEEEVTQTHNDKATNVKLANFKVWGVKESIAQEGVMTGIPNRIVALQDPKNDIVALNMGEVYPSEGIYEATTLNLAERRVGLSDLGIPRPSQVLGTRTPASTAASLLQAGNNRFAPAFDNIRRLLTDGVKQCLWRYHERLRTEPEGGPAERNIRAVLGDPRAQLVIDLLKTDDFLQSVAVELTASNASINRDADRQNSILLANFMGAWGEKILQLIGIASSTQTPEPVREAARKLAIAASAIAERTVRTFDQIRDPSRYIVDVEAELDKSAEITPGPLQAIQQLLGGGAPGATMDPTKLGLA